MTTGTGCGLAGQVETKGLVSSESFRGGDMDSTKKTARIAGLLYLVNGVTGFFSIIYVPGKLIVSGNTAATANNILASETEKPLGTHLRGRIYLPALGSLPITQRGEQDACFADGDSGFSLRSHYVREYAERDRRPDALAGRRFPIGLRPIAT